MEALDDVGAVTDTFAYDELAKVNAVKTFQNDLGSFKVGRDAVSFRSPKKCLAVESSSSLPRPGKFSGKFYEAAARMKRFVTSQLR